MNKSNKQNKIKINESNTFIQKTIYIFFISLPIIDLITSIIRRYNANMISLGQVVKVLGMGFVSFYLFFLSNSNKIEKRKNIKLLFLLLIFMIIFLINRIMDVGQIAIIEITSIFKYLYFPIMFLGIYDMLSNNIINKENLKSIIILNLVVIGLTIIIAYISNTSFSSYKSFDKGLVGWFFAANEIGVIQIIGMYLLFEQVMKNLKLISLYIILLIVCLNLGTKVIIYGLFIHLLASIIFYIINKDKKKALIVLIILLAQIIIIKNQNYLINDSMYHVKKIDKETVVQEDLNNNSNKIKETIETENEKPVIEETDKVSNNIEEEEFKTNSKIAKIINALLSRRLYFLQNTVREYKQSSFKSQLFGIGHKDFEGEPFKDVEMDLFSLPLRYGIVGAIIYMIVFFEVITTLPYNLKKSKDDFGLLMIVMATSVSLLIGAIIGHVYFSPAVSIYVAILLAILLNEKNKTDSKSENRIKL